MTIIDSILNAYDIITGCFINVIYQYTNFVFLNATVLLKKCYAFYLIL